MHQDRILETSWDYFRKWGWKQTQKNYWSALYQRLKGVTIDGQKIKFGTPGAYGQKIEKGFAS